MTRALVIGGTGFIGQAACKELMRRGVETVAASRASHPYGTFTSHIAFDRRDEAWLRQVLDEVRPDVLLDLACFQPSELAAALRNFRGRRYVFVSTGVYPDRDDGSPAREEDFVPLDGEPPAEPLQYREGKRWCETLLARSGDVPWVVVRPPAVFGAEDPSLRIAAYLERIEDGGPLLVPAETYQRQAGVAWVRDVGYACALAGELDRDLRGPYNVAFDGVSLETLLEAAGAAMGRGVRLLPVPFAELPEGASNYGPDPRRPAGYDLSRSRHELGFAPSGLEDALAETLTWYRVRRPSHPGYAGRPAELELASRLRGGEA
jgi:nucleoside-diphosphate-sugar epimerase